LYQKPKNLLFAVAQEKVDGQANGRYQQNAPNNHYPYKQQAKKRHALTLKNGPVFSGTNSQWQSLLKASGRRHKRLSVVL
jgi:hypothetical protein